ncbi:unnamed protein product [Gongylonema pulchrum]|uniref:Glyco_hydro_38C domain-containing protein n=1 Tax=Gongylonema pulchrum TaxID=637853 RepID=A0A183D3L4_9BILA|nr:unnamed protein product [Gongylonema pulchrum]
MATVWSSNEKPINIQINKAFYNGAQLKHELSAPYELLLPASISALGFATFFLSNQTKKETVEYAKIRSVQEFAKKDQAEVNTTFMSNEHIELTFDSSGQLVSLKNLESGKITKLRQEFLMYKGMGFAKPKNQSSGAYVFRPNGTKAFPITNATSSAQFVKVLIRYHSNAKRQFGYEFRIFATL